MDLSGLPKTRKEAVALGSRHYFTGKPCKRGHISRRLVSKKSCAECDKSYSGDWRAKNLEKVRASHAEYNRTEKRRAYNGELKRSEKGRAARRANYVKNREKVKKQVAEWKNRNQEKAAADRKKWVSENPEVVRTYCRNRQALLRGAEGKHTKLDILAMYERQRGECLCCHASLASGYDVDHKHPISKGGSNDPSNLQLLCPRCNRSKGNKNYLEWRAEKQMRGQS